LGQRGFQQSLITQTCTATVKIQLTQMDLLHLILIEKMNVIW